MNLGGRTSCYLSVLLITSKLQSSKYPLCDHHLISTATGCYKFAHKLNYTLEFLLLFLSPFYFFRAIKTVPSSESASSLFLSHSFSISPSFSGVCGCCGALRPRYKRLVDNIFPEDPEVRCHITLFFFLNISCLLLTALSAIFKSQRSSSENNVWVWKSTFY